MIFTYSEVYCPIAEKDYPITMNDIVKVDHFGSI